MDLEITVHDLKARREAGDDFMLLDCREALELQIAALDGAVHIPMGEIPARLDEIDAETPCAVLCHHGVRSLRVAMWLAQQGYTKVMSVRGGIDAWSKAIDPSVPIY